MFGSRQTLGPRRVVLTGLAVLITVVVAGVVAAMVLAWRVDGASMEPTIANGDRVLVRPGSSVQRFDVVVARFSERGPAFVKRVIGLPGDAISIERLGDGRGVVRVQPGGKGPWRVVTSTAWNELWRNAITQNCCAADGTSSVEPTAQRVPEGMLFVLGDNLAVSEDSRKLGWVRIGMVEGSVVFRILPLSSLGTLTQPVLMTPPAQH